MNTKYNYIDFTNYVVDLKSIDTNFKSFKHKLENLQNVNVNDKIGFDDDDKLYIDRSNALQPLIRWFYKQNRETSLAKLCDILGEYKKLLKLINISLYKVNEDNDELRILSNDIKGFNLKLIVGLDNLKETYKYDEAYKKKISDVQHILTNFEKGF